MLASGVALGVVFASAGCNSEAPLEGSTTTPEVVGFERIATFPVVLNRCNDAPSFTSCAEVKTIAEIVAATDDGETLIYTDAETGSIGFVDITVPVDPQPAGTLAVGGIPTSVVVAGRHALVVIDTGVSHAAPDGALVVIDTRLRNVVATIDLGGQPDSIAVGSSGRFAAIAMENERDPEVAGGAMPQLPAGFLAIVDMVGPPEGWTIRRVDLVGIAAKYPEDPEPEFVDINDDDVAAVTLQENNHVVLIDLESGGVVGDFSAGTVRFQDPETVAMTAGHPDAMPGEMPREPDAVHWLSVEVLATADEGDLEGGGRGFTLFDRTGRVRYTSGRTVEQIVRQHGFATEDAGAGRGTEPEGLEFARFGDEQFLFVGPERSGAIVVCRIGGGGTPELLQVLPAGPGPEGILAIPDRGLLVVASEQDDPERDLRSALTIYRYTAASDR